jgi:hypothetical protein
MKLQDKRNHKVKCQYGMLDYYKFYKKTNDKPQSKQVHSAVLKEFLAEMRDAVSQEGYIFTLPQRMGKIELRKIKREVKVNEDGSIVNTLNTNWVATKKLWEENLEAKIKKTRIRYLNEHTDGYIFKITYLKNTANFKNKGVYSMSLNRAMRRSTEQPIINHKIDAFLLN